VIGASFDSTKTPLADLLSMCHSGKLQLPDFQRGWVWDDDRIRSLLASVSVSFPIGAVMLLQAGGAEVKFKPRRLSGTPSALDRVVPDTLILDGQQRLTSLYQSLRGVGPVETKDSKNRAMKRWYYLDMVKAVSAAEDREDAVISVPEEKVVKAFGGEIQLDVSDRHKEFASHLFPVRDIFASADWRQEYSEYWHFDREEMRLFNDFEREVIKRFEQYQVPVIELKKETPKEAVCLVFERVNTGGVALTVFELLTAAFAADNFQLRDDWEKRERRLKERLPVLRGLQSDDFLQAMSLLVTQDRRRQAISSGTPAERIPGISCKRRDILRLEISDWKGWADGVEEGLERAARFLHGQKIFNGRDLPYRTQLVPLAAIFADLGKDSENDGAKQKIAQWYWCGVLGELYGGATETRFARDLPEVVSHIRGESGPPSTVEESAFRPSRLLTLRTRNSSAYKGIYALLMRDGCRDFRTGEPVEAQTFFEDRIDIHHIFPERWCKDAAIDPSKYDSVINKTALSAKTNRAIGGRAPSDYLPILQRSGGIPSDRMDEILRTHRIDPGTMRADGFWDFFGLRAEELLIRLESATGKAIIRTPGLFGPAPTVDDFQDGTDDYSDPEMLAPAS
jgi:hypothetical protein